MSRGRVRKKGKDPTFVFSGLLKEKKNNNSTAPGGGGGSKKNNKGPREASHYLFACFLGT